MKFYDYSGVVGIVRGWEEVWQAYNSGDGVVISWQCRLLGRHVIAKDPALNGPQRRSLEACLDRLTKSAYQVQPLDRLMERTVRVIQVHGLTPTQSIELASALIWVSEATTGVRYVSLDQDLRAAAQQEGFTVEPENDVADLASPKWIHECR